MIIQYRALVPDDIPLVQEHFPGIMPVPDMQGIVAENECGHFQGCAIFGHWSPSSVQAHVIVENPMLLRHGFLEEAARYVFITCDRGVIIGLVPSNNEKALKLDAHIGFKEVGRVRDGHDFGVDTVIMELRRENCRWLGAH